MQPTPFITRNTGILLSVFFAAFIGIALTSGTGKTPGNEEDKSYLHFPEPLSPQTPYDVDLPLERTLVKEGNVDEAQRLFDILSWQMFLSLNWPRDAKGAPRPAINDKGETSWEHWKESFEIFKENGTVPDMVATREERPFYLQSATPDIKVLYRASKAAAFHQRSSNKNIADEIDQAFTAPIWDQNGNIVRYEIRLNNVMTHYLVSNQLYNIDGQIAFSQAGKKVRFPLGRRAAPGVMEVKAAWKVLDPEKDIAERFYHTQAMVINPDGTYSSKTVGLVGMHISTKTESSPQWVWATFEQVDNLETNPLKKVNGKKLHPSFYDPACGTCAVNTFPDTTVRPVKNQIQRVLPIGQATQELNRQVQQLLAAKGSFWQYYQLIGTQWSTDPTAKPYTSSSTDTTVYTLPAAITNKSGGKPVPAYLTNMIMETYFQGGTVTSPVARYNEYLGNEPAYFQIQNFPSNVDTANTNQIVFGTESCVGCHFSSAIATGFTLNSNHQKTAVYGNPGTADFEWLLQLKAQFKTDTTGRRYRKQAVLKSTAR